LATTTCGDEEHKVGDASFSSCSPTDTSRDRQALKAAESSMWLYMEDYGRTPFPALALIPAPEQGESKGAITLMKKSAFVSSPLNDISIRGRRQENVVVVSLVVAVLVVVAVALFLLPLLFAGRIPFGVVSRQRRPLSLSLSLSLFLPPLFLPLFRPRRSFSFPYYTSSSSSSFTNVWLG